MPLLTNQQAIEKLSQLIEASGLSRVRFARWVLGRDERTLRRWLSGDIEIPAHAREWITALQSVRDGNRITVVIEPPGE